MDPAFEKLLETEQGTPELKAMAENQKQAEVERKRVARESRAAAMELVRSGGWEWFERAMTLLAEEQERTVSNVHSFHDTRKEDRLRGMAYVYRRIPRLIVETANQDIEE